MEPTLHGSWPREFRFYDTTRPDVIPDLLFDIGVPDRGISCPLWAKGSAEIKKHTHSHPAKHFAISACANAPIPKLKTSGKQANKLLECILEGIERRWRTKTREMRELSNVSPASHGPPATRQDDVLASPVGLLRQRPSVFACCQYGNETSSAFVGRGDCHWSLILGLCRSSAIRADTNHRWHGTFAPPSVCEDGCHTEHQTE